MSEYSQGYKDGFSDGWEKARAEFKRGEYIDRPYYPYYPYYYTNPIYYSSGQSSDQIIVTNNTNNSHRNRGDYDE
jgi:hypothetical protein